MLIEIWSLQSKKEPKVTDAYLDKLATVATAGFLREYVWTYLGSRAWKTKPDGLRLDDFETWRMAHLPTIELIPSRASRLSAQVSDNASTTRKRCSLRRRLFISMTRACLTMCNLLFAATRQVSSQRFCLSVTDIRGLQSKHDSRPAAQLSHEPGGGRTVPAESPRRALAATAAVGKPPLWCVTSPRIVRSMPSKSCRIVAPIRRAVLCTPGGARRG